MNTYIVTIWHVYIILRSIGLLNRFISVKLFKYEIGLYTIRLTWMDVGSMYIRIYMNPTFYTVRIAHIYTNWYILSILYSQIELDWELPKKQISFTHRD